MIHAPWQCSSRTNYAGDIKLSTRENFAKILGKRPKLEVAWLKLGSPSGVLRVLAKHWPWAWRGGFTVRFQSVNGFAVPDVEKPIVAKCWKRGFPIMGVKFPSLFSGLAVQRIDFKTSMTGPHVYSAIATDYGWRPFG